jgi:hypothetical protein
MLVGILEARGQGDTHCRDALAGPCLVTNPAA